MSEQIRIDKWLWAVRIFKTRSIATEACKKGRIYVDDSQAKASRIIKPGDVISVKKPPVTYKFRVEALIGKRVGAKLVNDYTTNITPASELEILEIQRNMAFLQRDKGTGRPTKKERRDIDSFFDENWEDWDD